MLAAAAVAAGLHAGGDERGAGAAALAPPDTLLFVRASTDDPVWELARRFPSLRAVQDGLPAGAGGEVAVALTAAGPLVIAESDRPGGVRAGGFVLSGPEAEVQAAVRRSGGGPSLAGDPAYRRAAAELDGAAAIFAPAAGLRRLLLDAPALVRAAAAFAEAPGFEGVAAEAETADGGLRISARVLRAPGAAPAQEFVPALLGRVPADAAAHLALPGADALASLLARAGAGATIDGLRSALPGLAGLDLDRDVLAPLGVEAGITITAQAETPVITVAARSSNPALTREALARLQAPLAEALGVDPIHGFEQREGGGFVLAATPQLQPSYAVQGDVLVASTAEEGLRQTRAAPRGVAQQLAVRRVIENSGGRVEALGFLAVSQLLALGERTGLTTSPALPAARDDLLQVRAAGAVVRREEADSIAELFLEIP